MSGRARVKPTEQPPTDAAGDHVVKARPERRKHTKQINCDVVADNLFTIMVQQPDAVPLRPLKLGKLHFKSNIGDALKCVLAALGYNWSADGTNLVHVSCGKRLVMGKWSGKGGSRRPDQPVHKGFHIHSDDDHMDKLKKILSKTDNGLPVRPQRSMR